LLGDGCWYGQSGFLQFGKKWHGTLDLAVVLAVALVFNWVCSCNCFWSSCLVCSKDSVAAAVAFLAISAAIAAGLGWEYLQSGRLQLAPNLHSTLLCLTGVRAGVSGAAGWIYKHLSPYGQFG
jgi:hypothetical protein